MRQKGFNEMEDTMTNTDSPLYYVDPVRDTSHSEYCKCGNKYENIYSAFTRECQQCERYREAEMASYY